MLEGGGGLLRPAAERLTRWRVTGQDRSLEAEVRSSGEVREGVCLGTVSESLQ